MTKKKLTVKEAKLVKAKAKGMSNADAYKAAGYSMPATKEAAVVNASKVLSRPNVKEALQVALDKHGLTPDRIIQVVSDGMNATKVNIVRDPMGGEDSAFAEETPDHSIRLKAAGMAANFMGINKESSGNTINFVQITEEQKDRYAD